MVYCRQHDTRCIYWGVHLTAGQPDPKVDQMSSSPYVVLLLAMRCLYRGVHLTTGLSDQSSHTHGHKMSLPGEGQVDILFNRQSASQPAAIGQPTSHVTKYQPVRLWVGQIFGGRRTRSLTTLSPSTPTGSFWGVTYLTKARQVTQLSSAACYIPLALCLGTICSFVFTLPNHIFLHAL